MTTTNRTRAALLLNRKKVSTVLAVANRMYSAMLANMKLFPAATPPLPTFLSQIQDVEAAQLATGTRTRGTAAIRNAKLAILFTTMESLRMYVQTLCDANPEQAEVIITAAGMAIARVPSFHKPALAAKLGTQSGSVILEANATLLVGKNVSKKATFNWEYSAGGGKTWIAAPSTPLTTTTIVGLTPLTTYEFRVCATVSKSTGEWSQAVSLLVR
jgi:hypothetical protein